MPVGVRAPVMRVSSASPERTRAAQVVKQADVLMLHHLVPDEVAADSLGPNLDFYEPRTAHGSSLSPAVHASLLARPAASGTRWPRCGSPPVSTWTT